MPIYRRSPRVQEILTYGAQQAKRLREIKQALLLRPLHEWVEFEAPPEQPPSRAETSGKRKPRPSAASFLKPWLRTLTPTGAMVSLGAELVLASYAYTALRLIVAPTAFFNLAILVRVPGRSPLYNRFLPRPISLT